MLILNQSALRSIIFAKHDVSDRMKTRIFPRCEESIDFAPAVEHHGHSILLEHTVGFFHCRFEPAIIVVVLNAASCAITIIHQVWRIAEDEIYRVRWHLPHHLDAVAVKNGVDVVALPDLNCRRHGMDLLWSRIL